MATLEMALADFGQDIGVQALAPGPSGAVQLRFDHGATLGFFRRSEEVVLHWSEPVPFEGPEVLLRAFKRVAEPSPGEPPLQVGLRAVDGVDNLVLVARLQERQCGARELRHLTSWLRQYAADLKN